MFKNNYAVIMAGGIGSRFWPFSRTRHPKQFHDVLGTGKTLIQQTVERFEPICPKENILIVTNKLYKDLCLQQLPFLNDDQILCEPIGRNTAPCVAYAVYKIKEKNPDANVVVAPSDHVILKEGEFQETVKTALQAGATDPILITLGIKPSRPDTGYGYIQYLDTDAQRIKKVKTFTEKPPLEMAKQFLESGDFVWNAGIFIFNLKTIKQAFEKYMPDMAEIFAEGSGFYWTGEEEAFISKAYSNCKNISIDYGIMEKADNVHVILGDFGWSDLGTWKSLYDNSKKDKDGNVIDGQVMSYDVKNCIIKTPKDKLVVLHGVEELIVAEYDGVLMICKLDQEQKVRDFVADVKNNKDQKFS